MPESSHLFAEHRCTSEATVSRGVASLRPYERTRGVSVATPPAAGREWRYLASARPDELPTHWREPVRDLLAEQTVNSVPPEQLLASAQTLHAAALEAGATRADITVFHTVQRILVGDAESAPATDVRTSALAEVRIHLGTGPAAHSVWRPVSLEGPTALEPALACIRDLVALLTTALPRVRCPDGERTIVFPPGAASGSFFHELCGHPLEGDVVARKASYLAQRIGQQVAPAFFTLSDAPASDPAVRGAVSYRLDDEGSPAQAVDLIRHGVVTAPLLDGMLARLSGKTSNGHGRRVSYRHPPLPRMGHTTVRPHEGTLESLVAGVERGVLVQHLNPRQMNLLSGDFSFYLVEGRLIEDGKLGALLLPGVLSGNGLAALGGIDAVGSDCANITSRRGCRKLDHGPLQVSFGQPSLRFKALRVAPWGGH